MGQGTGMTPELTLSSTDFESRAISPFQELGAYEALWDEPKTTFKTLSDKFAARPGAVPSDFVPPQKAREYAEFVQEKFRLAAITRFGVRVHGAGDYPEKLRDAAHPIELLYYQGWWDLVDSRCVAVVGTRKPSPEGIKRTQQLVRKLVKDDFTAVSGLATGVDTVVHETAIECDGRTIAVIGTPLSHTYPRDNVELQRRIARDFLLISQVPVRRYEAQDYRMNRLFFPERNVTMSALTEATIIVEAGDTSGTLIQARAALQQGRKLFILDSCFRNPSISWPQKYADKGAIRVMDYDDIRQHLSPQIN
jgi:DNA processing protein